jgi:hypothetical protein
MLTSGAERVPHSSALTKQLASQEGTMAAAECPVRLAKNEMTASTQRKMGSKMLRRWCVMFATLKNCARF